MSITKKIKKNIKNPVRMIYTVQNFFRRRNIIKIVVDGKTYYVYKGEAYPDYLNTGNAAHYILDTAKKYCSGKGVDIGAGNHPFPGAIGIDDDPKENAYKLDRFEPESLDYVFSSHCLEHLTDWQSALKLWISKIKKDGILFIYVPHKSMKLWNKGHPWVADNHKWIPTYEAIIPFLEQNNMKILEYNPDRDKYWSFHIAARKL